MKYVPCTYRLLFVAQGESYGVLQSAKSAGTATIDPFALALTVETLGGWEQDLKMIGLIWQVMPVLRDGMCYNHPAPLSFLPWRVIGWHETSLFFLFCHCKFKQFSFFWSAWTCGNHGKTVNINVYDFTVGMFRDLFVIWVWLVAT